MAVFWMPQKQNRQKNGRKTKNFDFCICISLNLCYRGFIPVVEVVETTSSSRK